MKKQLLLFEIMQEEQLKSSKTLDNNTTILLGDFIFEEQPLQCKINMLKAVIVVPSEFAETIAESLIIENKCESYVILGKYKGEIIF
jgi:hypothetical protein